MVSFSDTIIAGAIGGLISLLLLPFASCLFLRLFNRLLTVVEIEFPLDNSIDGYITHPMRIRNNTFSTIPSANGFGNKFFLTVSEAISSSFFLSQGCSQLYPFVFLNSYPQLEQNEWNQLQQKSIYICPNIPFHKRL